MTCSQEAKGINTFFHIHVSLPTGAGDELGEVHLWHRMKQLSIISPSVSQPTAGIKSRMAGTHLLALQCSTTELTGLDKSKGL